MERRIALIGEEGCRHRAQALMKMEAFVKILPIPGNTMERIGSIMVQTARCMRMEFTRLKA